MTDEERLQEMRFLVTIPNEKPITAADIRWLLDLVAARDDEIAELTEELNARKHGG